MAVDPFTTQAMQLTNSIAADPVKALRILRQRWDTLMTLASPAEEEQLGLLGPYRDFGIFYEGLVTVPASFNELKAGQHNAILASHVNKYYDAKRAHAMLTGKERPPPEEPAPDLLPPPPNWTPLLIIGAAVGGLALLGRRRGTRISAFGLTDDEHAAEMLHHIENAYNKMNRAEDYIAKRKSTGNCRVAYRSLKNVIPEAAVAGENFKAMGSPMRYSAVMSNLSTDYDLTLKRLTQRCGNMVLRPARSRRCAKWGKNKKGKRVCKQYRRVSVR